MNKKADDRYISPWLILNWTFIVIAVVIVVYLFYSTTIDVRLEESQLIGIKLIDCLVNLGEFNQNYLNENFDVFQECDLNKEIIENGNYYIHLSVYENGILKKETIQGTKKFETECKLEAQGDFPECYQDTFYAKTNSQTFEIKILTASNQQGGTI